MPEASCLFGHEATSSLGSSGFGLLLFLVRGSPALHSFVCLFYCHLLSDYVEITYCN